MSKRDDLDDKGVYNPPPRTKGPARSRLPRTYEGGPLLPDNEIAISFDRDGNYTDNLDLAYCKRVQTEQRVRHYVKFSTGGHDVGHMMNPVGLYFRPDRVAVSEAKTGRARYVFKAVSEAAFRDYLRFLTTKNETFLRSAERRVLDA
jgi:hypothetical protein